MVLNGELTLKSFSLNGFAETGFKKGKIFEQGIGTEFKVSQNH